MITLPTAIVFYWLAGAAPGTTYMAVQELQAPTSGASCEREAAAMVEAALKGEPEAGRLTYRIVCP